MAGTGRDRQEGQSSRQLPVFSPREVEALIADGRSIIIVDQHVLKVDAWLKYHPGGDKAIHHMVGRDATDEVNSLHSAEARQMMSRYRIGKIEGRWKNFVPPIQGGVYRPASVGDEKEHSDVQARFTTKDTSSPSDASSRSPSPPAVFDTTSETRPGLRARGPTMAASVTSVSSVDELEEEPSDGMTHLDVLTRKHIKLDLEKYPSLDPSTQDTVVKKYRLLHDKMVAEGLFECNYYDYARECVRYTSLFTCMLLFLRWGWYTISACFLGAFWHQLVFAAHDSGHMGITHKFHVDTVIGIIIADFIGGLSLGWWKRSHNVHHIVTNSPEHDPDIEYIPLFAVSHRFLQSLRSTYHEKLMPYDAMAKILVPVQQYLYYPVMLLARFNLYRLSWEYLLLGQGPKKGPAWWHRYLEFAGQVFFWTWFGYGVMYKSIDTNWHRFVFLMVSHMVTSPLHVQITLSHFAMSTADLGQDESFPQKMLRTTMDVDCPEWLDWFHGGLQFQAIHHLFPRMPRHNLRHAQKLVQEFCDDVGIPYALYGFVDGNKEVIGRLADVARQAAILAKCQGVMATGGHGNGHHA
ncbi:fatty acid desaturase-domain-containing protein [Apodospora peruviana]|uniref:Delta 8-(E)-sphingolipid desaturase n=1 Tax=Apodospora peruviana TaxID=516989 RepID=A0AAE0IBU5_9PEZI|nr:fatty acid desaturase-domain-containing protein [Apodospora peruviana]